MERCQEIHQQHNLQCCIKALLLDADSRWLIKAFTEERYDVPEERLVRLLREESKGQTIDQLKAIARMFYTQWRKAGDTEANVKYAKHPTLFNMLLHFVDGDMLHMGDKRVPVCQGEGLLRWNELTNQIGEDVMVCAYLAGHDLLSPIMQPRKEFNWDPFIRTDDQMLNMILEMPLADIHAHLKGSSVNFDINWICLMNHIEERSKDFTDLAKTIQSDHADDYQDGGELYKKALLAAAIRLHLLDMVYFKRNRIAEQMIRVMECQGKNDVIQKAKDIQTVIEDTRKGIGKQYKSSNGDIVIFDYAIIQGVSIDKVDSNTILSGERYLLYGALHNIYNGRFVGEKIQHLLLLYLVIKNEIRHEITQLNDAIGFDNFNIYENRKLVFVDGSKYKNYKNAAFHLAISGFIGDADPKHRYHEVRITPKASGDDILKDIKNLDAAIENDLLKKEKENWIYRYIFHFIKKPDGPVTADCRHFDLRKSVKMEAKAIYNFRNGLETNGNGVYWADRAVGIDAANSEIACRPEVFAQAFRYLREHKVKHPAIHKPNNLGITYHVGEDFMDVIDGLRAVTEAITFLQLRKGDRIGHGLVLGVNVADYYHARNYTVTMSLQMMMDNMAWLYHYVRGLKGFVDLLGEIKENYEHCYRRVYEDCLVPSIDVYYNSMMLRGDSPEFYKVDGTVMNLGDGISEWIAKSLNSDKACVKARELREARMLYHQYHYDVKGKQRGNDFIEWEVSPHMIEAIERTQKDVLKKVEELGLAIECNPTSNIKIGEFNRYDEHPILRFNNEGLGLMEKKSLSVSINTDDRGVFATSIEREYALMAHALIRYFHQEKSSISNNDVYNWLDRIRVNSLLQRFDKSDKHFDEPSKSTIDKHRQQILEEIRKDEKKELSLWERLKRLWHRLF